ncbi:gag-aspartyl protease domain-containing protein [Tanacetum coccineum]
MLAHENEDASNGGSIGSMKILNAMKEKTEVPKVVWQGLQYVEATINGVKVHALVDFGATHNFVAVDEANRLGINATKGSRTIKAVNSEAKPIHGVDKDVRAKIGEWEGTIDLSMVSMDNFKVVLRLEFLDKLRAFPMSFANPLCILDGGKTCIVNKEWDAKSIAKTLLVMQLMKVWKLERGLNKGDEECSFDLKEDEVVPRVDAVSLVNGFFDGAFSEEAWVESMEIKENEENCGEDDEESDEAKRRKIDGSKKGIVNCTENQKNTVKILVTPVGVPLKFS